MANTTSYMLKFGADATSVTKAITGVNSDIRSMSTQAKNLDTAFRLTGDTSALKGKLQALGNQLSATEAKGKLLKQELANLKKLLPLHYQYGVQLLLSKPVACGLL